MSKTNEEQSEKGKVGVGAVDYRTACLRLPRFPLQLLCRQRPAWRGEKVAWLETLKADAPLRYLSSEAREAGLAPGVRYATALGLIPDLLAGTSSAEDLAVADRGIQKLLRRFSPNIRRASAQCARGLYLLDASGLSRAFSGMRNWAQSIVESFTQAGWDVRLAVGFTPFACEMATYHLTPERPIRLFDSHQEEQERTLRTPLSAFSLGLDQLRRLQRFGIVVLEDFLALEIEEVRRRFGADLLEFYGKASEAIFADFSPLPEEEPLWADHGFPDPVSDWPEILEATVRLLTELLPRLVRREEAVSELRLWLLTEDGERIFQRLSPSSPSADSHWLGQLLRLRLEADFQQRPLRWGKRVERVVLLLVGEPDPEKQGELFSDWACAAQEGESVPPRDRQAGLWALSRVRAQYGDHSLRQAQILDHHLPGRDFSWVDQREHQDWFRASRGGVGVANSSNGGDLRVRRRMARPLMLSGSDRWSDKEGPFWLDGGWWEKPFARQYYFAREGSQTGWLYWDQECERWFVEGWLQ